MGMDVGGAGGGLKSEINVVPMCDIMLVLLIITMIIAPMLQQGVDLTLPIAMNTAEKPDTADNTTVFIDSQDRLYINAIQMTEAQLVNRLTTVLETAADRTVYLKGDREASYGAIMRMMDALRAANIDTVALIADRPAGEDSGG